MNKAKQVEFNQENGFLHILFDDGKIQTLELYKKNEEEGSLYFK